MACRHNKDAYELKTETENSGKLNNVVKLG